MRKSAIAVAILAAMTVNVSVLADEVFIDPAWYTGDSSDSAAIDASGYSLVYITKDSDGSIVYIDQIDDVYSGSMGFLLKSNPEVGKYNVYLGADSRPSKETYFYVGADSNTSGALYMKRLKGEESNGEQEPEDPTWNIGYYAMIPASAYNNYTALKVGYNEGGTLKYGSFPLDKNWESEEPVTYSGDGDLYLMFQLNNVPAAYVDSAAVYLVPSSSGGGE